jgi:hypothetical protein
VTQDGIESLAIVVPLPREPDDLSELVEQVERHVPPPFELYAVYDSESDAALGAARTLATSRPWLRLLRNDVAPGVVGAVRAGFSAVRRGPCLVTLADAGDDLSVVPKLLALHRQGYRIVCPSRFAPGGCQRGGAVAKRLLLRVTGLSLQVLIGFPTRDLNNNFRLYDASLVNQLDIESTEGFELALELTAKAFRRGCKIVEVPTTWTDRRSGTSSTGMRTWLARYLRWYIYALRSGRRRP